MILRRLTTDTAVPSRNASLFVSSSRKARVLAAALVSTFAISACSSPTQSTPAPTPSKLSAEELKKLEAKVTSQDMYDTPKQPKNPLPSTFMTTSGFQVRDGQKSGPDTVKAKPGEAVTLVIGVDTPSQFVIEGTDVKIVIQPTKKDEGIAVVVAAPKKAGSYKATIAGYGETLFTLVVSN